MMLPHEDETADQCRRRILREEARAARSRGDYLPSPKKIRREARKIRDAWQPTVAQVLELVHEPQAAARGGRTYRARLVLSRDVAAAELAAALRCGFRVLARRRRTKMGLGPTDDLRVNGARKWRKT